MAEKAKTNAGYELGDVYQTSSGNPPRDKATPYPADKAEDFVKMQSNTKGTGSLAGQPMKKQRKTQLPAVANPDPFGNNRSNNM